MCIFSLQNFYIVVVVFVAVERRKNFAKGTTAQEMNILP